MTVDYKISSTLVVKDDLSAALERVAALALKANSQMAELTRNVMKAGRSFAGATQSVDAFGRRSTDMFGKMVSGSIHAKTATDNITKSMAALAAQTTAAARAGNTAQHPGMPINPQVGHVLPGGGLPQGGGAGGAGGAGGGHGAALNAAAYSHMGGVLRSYGDGMLESLKAPIDRAIELERATAGMRQKGLGDAQIAEAMKFVRATEIYGTSIIDRARIFNEAQGSFRESGMSGGKALDAAKVMTPALAGYQVAMSTLDDKSHAAAEGSFSQLNKVVELMGGLNSSERAKEIVDAVFKAVQSSGKMVSERDIRMFTTQGGSAVANLSDKTIFAGLEPLMGEFGGSALGTGMNTAYRNLSGLMAHPSKMMVGEAIKMGIWDKNQIQFNSQGGIGKILNRDKLANPELLNLMRTDTIAFTKALMKIYESNGVTTKVGRERDNEILLGRNGAKAYNKMMQQLEVMENSMVAYDAAKGVGQTNTEQHNSPMQKIMEAQKRYADLQMEFGIVVLPLLISGLEQLIPLFKTYAGFIHDHPVAVRALTVAFAGLAAAMVFGGSVLLLSGAMSGLGIALNVLTAGTGVPALIAVLGAPLLGPIAIAVSAIGLVAAAFYAFRGLTKAEVDAAKIDGGAKLTPEARARASAAGMPDTDSAEFLKGVLAGKKSISESAGSPKSNNYHADMAAAIKSALNGTVVNMDGESVGRLVSGHQGREAGRPSTGTSGYDSRLSVTRPDYSGL